MRWSGVGCLEPNMMVPARTYQRTRLLDMKYQTTYSAAGFRTIGLDSGHWGVWQERDVRFVLFYKLRRWITFFRPLSELGEKAKHNEDRPIEPEES